MEEIQIVFPLVVALIGTAVGAYFAVVKIGGSAYGPIDTKHCATLC